MDPRPIDILLVDDEARNLDALEVILAAPGYRLIRALNGDAALKALLEYDIAAMVLDIRMPDIGGVELAHIIKGTKKFREIPILFLTAHLLDDQDIVAGYGAGAVDYLTKPVNPLIFRHKIAVFADLFRKTRALAELNSTLESRVQERTAELEKSEAALREADRQKDEFLATLAHELRNPLAPLRMGFDLLTRTSSGSANTLMRMNRQLDHMVRLIDDLLDVARISGGNFELKKERVSVAEAIQTAVETCRPLFERRRQIVSTQTDTSLFALADPTRLAQIVSNLLHNACKFTPEEGEVSVSLTHESGRAVIRVTDSGVGIEAGQLGRIFEMFTRVEASTANQHGGLGIGLALSRKLAALHEGDISVTSQGAGKGSVFTFTLPAQIGAPREADATPNAPLPTPSGPVTVLVIEDIEDSAEMLALMLESRGYVPIVAHTGETGLALFEKERPQVVVCDIGLPEMDGIEVCKRMRAMPLDYVPVVIALTGWGMQEDVRRTKDAGFDFHLVKPVAPDALFRLLAGVTASPQPEPVAGQGRGQS